MHCCFRLSDKLGTKSAESLRILMFSWFKLFLESVVAFGDTAKEVVKIVFKYFNSVRGKMSMLNNKQLLDEAEHDIKNYSDRGQCYLPKRS